MREFDSDSLGGLSIKKILVFFFLGVFSFISFQVQAVALDCKFKKQIAYGKQRKGSSLVIQEFNKRNMVFEIDAEKRSCEHVGAVHRYILTTVSDKKYVCDADTINFNKDHVWKGTFFFEVNRYNGDAEYKFNYTAEFDDEKRDVEVFGWILYQCSKAKQQF